MNTYTVHKKLETKSKKTTVPEECYARRAKVWLWLLGVLVTGISIYVVVVFSEQNRKKFSAPNSSSHGSAVHAQPVALAQCPYCPGHLDAQGQGDVKRCPIYSPDWGKNSKRQDTGQTPVAIKELALEVLDGKGMRGVIIHAVYPGGNADKAGLREEDMISRFNGHKVKTIEDLQMFVVRAKPEAMVKVRIVRNGGKWEPDFAVMIGEGEMEGATVPAFDPVSGAARGRLL